MLTFKYKNIEFHPNDQWAAFYFFFSNWTPEKKADLCSGLPGTDWYSLAMEMQSERFASTIGLGIKQSMSASPFSLSFERLWQAQPPVRFHRSACIQGMQASDAGCRWFCEIARFLFNSPKQTLVYIYTLCVSSLVMQGKFTNYLWFHQSAIHKSLN